jgi:putative membrane protein
MNTIRARALVLGLSAVALASFAAAQSPNSSSTSDPSNPMPNSPQPATGLSQDHARVSASAFVNKASIDGMTEVQVGQLALKKATDPAVRDFAQHMVTDHEKANSKLKTLASRKHIPVPAQLDVEHRNMVQMLGSKSGASFDAAYMEEMTAAHDKAIALFSGATSCDDSDIAAFASETLPTLQTHKQMADSLKSKS